MLLQGLKIIMAAIIIVFIIQTIRLGIIAHRSDPRSKSVLNAIKIVLTVPWSDVRNSGGFKNKFDYYRDLITGSMWTSYHNHVESTTALIKVKCNADPTDPYIKNIVVNSFTYACIITQSLDDSCDKVDFKKRVCRLTGVLTHLINIDLRELISSTPTLSDECPLEYDLITSIIQTSNLYDIDTNVVIISSLDYLQNIDLDQEYKIV